MPNTTEFVQQPLRSAILRLLRLLVRVLLCHAVACGTFAELTRKAYVEEAFSHISDSGRRATISDVSALTSLTRKETERLLELLVQNPAHGSEQRYNRANRVVSGWLADPRFLSGNGEPAALPLECDDSFATLVKNYSGDIPPRRYSLCWKPATQ